MAVLLETSMGDLVIELYTEECPNACTNFLKLCKIKHYNNCLFHTVEKNFIVKSGDPTNSGKTGSCIWSFLSDKKQFFDDEIRRSLTHNKMGIVAMGNVKPDENGSAFYITLNDKIDYLDGKHTIFGFVSEGIDVLEKINEVVVDDDKKPFNNIRILHTVILDDPMEDPVGLTPLIPLNSPEVCKDLDYEANQEQIDEVELLENLAKADAKSRAINLELLGDLPDADMKPPENVLFVCKLNPVTQDGDLELIFSRFGNIVSCEIIRDWKTGDSLQYAFVEFDNVQSAEEAYFKMQDCLIDDRRIHVDFSQSVAKHWNLFKRNGARATAEDAEQLPFSKGKGKGKGKRQGGGKDRQNSRREGEENSGSKHDASGREEGGKIRDERKDEKKNNVDSKRGKRLDAKQREHNDESSVRRKSQKTEHTGERRKHDPTSKSSTSRDQSKKAKNTTNGQSKSRSLPRTKKHREETKKTDKSERSMSSSRRESKTVERRDRSRSPSSSKKKRTERSRSQLRRENKKNERKDRSRSASQSKRNRKKDRSTSRSRQESKKAERQKRSVSRSRRKIKQSERKDRSRSKKDRNKKRSKSRTRC